MSSRAGVHFHDPRAGDKFWDGDRVKSGKQPNGTIIRTHREHGEWSEVEVTFHRSNDGTVDAHVAYYYFDIEGHYQGETLGYVINQ